MQEIDSLAKFGWNHLEWHPRVTGSRIPGSRLGKSRRQFRADLPVRAQECPDAFQRMPGVGYHVLVPDSHRCPGVGSFKCQVLGEIAQGYANPEIVRRLYLSEATVKTHVGRILAKLGLRDRVHVVIFAYDHGLVRPA